MINTVISVTVALPAAYAFSRFRFLGDKHLFFWLLTNRMAPAAVFALPFFQLYSAIGLFDTHIAVALAHCLFNIPLAVWILEGFMSSVPKQLDETAYLDGYGFWRFFLQDLPADHRGRHRRRGVLLLHVLLGRAAARQDADLGRRQADRRHDDANRQQLRLRARTARGRRNAHHHSGRVRDLFRAQLHRQGFCARARVSDEGRRHAVLSLDGLDVRDRRHSSPPIACLLVGMTMWDCARRAAARRRGVLAIETTRGDRLFISLLGGAYIHLAWLGLLGTPLWGATVMTLIFTGVVFRWV